MMRKEGRLSLTQTKNPQKGVGHHHWAPLLSTVKLSFMPSPATPTPSLMQVGENKSTSFIFQITEICPWPKYNHPETHEVACCLPLIPTPSWFNPIKLAILLGSSYSSPYMFELLTSCILGILHCTSRAVTGRQVACFLVFFITKSAANVLVCIIFMSFLFLFLWKRFRRGGAGPRTSVF